MRKIHINKDEWRERISKMNQTSIDTALWDLTASKRFTMADEIFLRNLLNQRQRELEAEVKR